jgi:predicted nucleic acid-binding protein
LTRNALSADPRLLYLDSSALVKLVIEEPESAELGRHVVDDGVALATSRIALVEVPRATGLANPAEAVQEEAQRLLGSCLLVAVGDRVLRSAAGLSSRETRTLDSIHLATALYIDADEMVAYDRRLLAAATSQGMRVASPG